MSIEENIKRIADSLEKLAGYQERSLAILEGIEARKSAQPVVTLVPVPPAPPAEAKTVPLEKSPKDMNREELKAELTRMGVAYNERARQETLLELLLVEIGKASATAAPIAVNAAELISAPAKPRPAGVPSLADEPPVKKETVLPSKGTDTQKLYTGEEARALLREFAAKWGAADAIAILNKFGCADVTTAEKKKVLNEFCTEVLKQKAEREAASVK